MADVFISYKRIERERVLPIEQLLREEDLSVWFDAHLELGRTEGFDAEIEREVNSAGAVLVCWTPESVESTYVRAEAKKGLERNVLVPVILQPCSLPVPFNIVDTEDLSEWGGDSNSSAWQRVLSRLRELNTKAAPDLSGESATGVRERIRQVAAEEHPGDFSTQNHVVQKQLHDWEKLRNFSDSGVPDDTISQIRRRTEAKHPDDYSTQLYVVEKQIADWKQLHGSGRDELMASEIPWALLEVRGRYFAWDGPLHRLEDRDAISAPQWLRDELTRLNLRPQFANEEEGFGPDKFQVFETDKQSWRKALRDGQRGGFLEVRPSQ